MSNRVPFQPKLAGETVPRMVDFISKIPYGVTISSSTCVASVQQGNDPAPASIVSGAATINGTQVTQNIAGGVLGTIYNLLFTANGSDSNVYQLAGYLAVVPNTP